ncbi:aminomethyltransferase beta-barrel domain-containing protein [Escherichia coli]
MDGKVIGEHQGLMYHTLGQRKGLGIGGRKDATEEAWYVVDKEVERNVLVVAQGEHPPPLLRWFDCQPIALGGIAPPIREPRRCTVKTRYHQQDIPCLIQPIDDETIRVIFDERAAVTPGQSAVFYDGEVCLGGGIIEQRLSHPV